MHEYGYGGGYDEFKPEKDYGYDGRGVNENRTDKSIDDVESNYFSSGNYFSNRRTGLDNPETKEREEILNNPETASDEEFNSAAQGAVEEINENNNDVFGPNYNAVRNKGEEISDDVEFLKRIAELEELIKRRIKEAMLLKEQGQRMEGDAKQMELILTDLKNKSVGDRQLDSRAMSQQDNNEVTSNLQQSSGKEDLNYVDKWGFVHKNIQDAIGGDDR